MLTDLDTEIEPNESHFLDDFKELSPYFDHTASFERGFCNIFKCTRVLFFVAMPSQSPSLPFDSVQACLHGRECVDFGQQTNMWFYIYSSMLCPQRVKITPFHFRVSLPTDIVLCQNIDCYCTPIERNPEAVKRSVFANQLFGHHEASPD